MSTITGRRDAAFLIAWGDDIQATLGYCASCGRQRKLRGNLCMQCSDDMRKGKRMRNVEFPLTLKGLEDNAKRYCTYTAAAFLVAVHFASTDGSAYGWK